ncbi:glycosyltransferase [Limosilactobacillus allomucosae]|uniref:Glycosyltransferase n=1 Tax=Limosilactobacillus allomucosae TaxID=3142938 RepID=A0AAU7C1T1_9LACO
MKLNFVCPELSGNGGTETVLVKALNHLSKNNQIKLYLTSIPENRVWLSQMNPDILIKEVKRNTKFDKMTLLLKTFLSAKNDECFVILGATIIKLAAFVRKIFLKKWPIVSWIHYSLINQDIFDPKNIKLADRHWAISTPIKHQLMDLGIPESKIYLILNPVSQYNGSLNISNQSSMLRLVYVGKIMLHGQKNLIELFDGVSKYPKEIHVDLFGADNSNGEVFNYIEKLKITEKCTFHGWQKNPWKKIINEIHPNALALTSKYEGLPMVMIEAMERGIPCLVADFSGYEDVLIEKVNGFVYRSDSTSDLVDKMHLLKENIFSADLVHKSVKKFEDPEYFERLDQAVNEIGEL